MEFVVGVHWCRFSMFFGTVALLACFSGFWSPLRRVSTPLRRCDAPVSHLRFALLYGSNRHTCRSPRPATSTGWSDSTLRRATAQTAHPIANSPRASWLHRLTFHVSLAMSPLNTDTTTSPLNEDVIYHILHQLRGSSSDLARAARVHSTWTNSARTHLYREVALPPSHIKDGDKSLVQLQRTLEGLGPMRSIKPLVGNSSLEGLKARVLSTARARYWQGFTSSLSRSSSPTRTGVSYKVDETLVNRIKAVRHSTERGLVALPRFEDLLRMCKSVTEVIVECTFSDAGF